MHTMASFSPASWPGHAYRPKRAFSGLLLVLGFILGLTSSLLAQAPATDPNVRSTAGSAMDHETPLAQEESPLTGAGLFGTFEFRFSDFDDMPQWNRVLRDMAGLEQARVACDEAGDCPGKRFAFWRDAVSALADEDTSFKINAVNRIINRIVPYGEDREIYGRSDYWAAPREFLARGGDCEDFAILKYVSLRELGVPEENMRIVSLRDTENNIDHAVLMVRHEGETHILDSNYLLVRQEDELPQYEPRVSVNTQYRWMHVSSAALAAGPSMKTEQYASMD